MKRRFFVLAVTTILTIPGIARALDARMQAILKRLDPETRLAQICDAEALTRINRDRNHFRPEHVMIDQLSVPQKVGNTLSGTGAVFRSGGDWYHFSFKCQTANDQLTILSFNYTVGQKIKRDQWSALNLY